MSFSCSTILSILFVLILNVWLVHLRDCLGENCFSTSHDHYPSISTFGYMHALSFKDQHSVFRSLGNRFDPRFILTAGSISRDYLLKYLGFCESQVFELGSPRSITVPGVLESSPASSSSTILVLPEGILDECLLLFRFSLECALHNPSLIFRWRTHPLIPVESVVSNIIGNTLLPLILLCLTNRLSLIFLLHVIVYIEVLQLLLLQRHLV